MSSSLQLEGAEDIYPHLSPFNSLHHSLSPNMRRTAYLTIHNPEECGLQLGSKSLSFSKPKHSLRNALYKNIKNTRNSSHFSLPIRMHICMHKSIYRQCDFPKYRTEKKTPKCQNLRGKFSSLLSS